MKNNLNELQERRRELLMFRDNKAAAIQKLEAAGYGPQTAREDISPQYFWDVNDLDLFDEDDQAELDEINKILGHT